jgi:hypothetical protein
MDNNMLEWGVAMEAFSNEADSGDEYLVETYSGGVLVVVVDGLGHGPSAAKVAKIAVAALEGHAHEPIESLFRRCHQSLLKTRGVVMSAASFSVLGGKMTWGGIGNVTGLLLRADTSVRRARETLLSRGGVVGYHLPSLRPVTISVSPGDILIFATDGLRSDFLKDIQIENTPQQIADYLLNHYGRTTDDSLVLVARYKGGQNE